ncbi:MAG: hypothetical protein ACR2HY_02125 [Acidimicrobiales bacterium]
MLLEAPLAFVTVVDTARSWYQSCVGLAPDAEQFAAVEEALRRGAEELGVDGLCQFIAGNALSSTAAHMAASIEAHVSDYRDGLPRDDTAILAVRMPASQRPKASLTEVTRA